MNVALDSAYSLQEEYWGYLDYLEAYFREIHRLYYRWIAVMLDDDYKE